MYILSILVTLVVGYSVGSNANIISPDAAFQSDSNLEGRIVGGHAVNIQEAPYQVSVRIDNAHSCGGSILSNKAILTAAHCFKGYNEHDQLYSFSAGQTSIQYGVSKIGGSANVIRAAKLILHEKYNLRTTDYDIALIFLAKDIRFSNAARAIPLASKMPVGASLIATGWGLEQSGGEFMSKVLRMVTVTLKSNSVCAAQYKKINRVITDRMLCAGYYYGGKDACQGDSGGPLVQNGQLVGVVSWGAGCAHPDFYGLYTSVPAVRQWIEKNLKKSPKASMRWCIGCIIERMLPIK